MYHWLSCHQLPPTVPLHKDTHVYAFTCFTLLKGLASGKLTVNAPEPC